LSKAAAEALTGNRKRTIERAINDVMTTSERIQKGPKYASPKKGTGYGAAKKTERTKKGVKTYGAPIGGK
jgi:hypothetical protein